MTRRIECRYSGRDFTCDEMQVLRELLNRQPPLNRHRLSRAFCRRIGWYLPNGGLKDRAARRVMLAMESDGMIRLPPTSRKRKSRQTIVNLLPETDPPGTPLPDRLDAVRPVECFKVTGKGRACSHLWNAFIARYHYLGYSRLVGAQMRYAVRSRSGIPLAMLSFGAAAWKVEPRDCFIGWSHARRERNLHLVVNNSRFLILPWAQSTPNLGSHILACIRRQLVADWHDHYGYAPLIVETFVEIPRFTGTIYRASGWTKVGTTKGRGRNDRYNQWNKPRKDIWLRPLRRDWKRLIRR